MVIYASEVDIAIRDLDQVLRRCESTVQHQAKRAPKSSKVGRQQSFSISYPNPAGQSWSIDSEISEDEYRNQRSLLKSHLEKDAEQLAAASEHRRKVEDLRDKRRKTEALRAANTQRLSSLEAFEAAIKNVSRTGNASSHRPDTAATTIISSPPAISQPRGTSVKGNQHARNAQPSYDGKRAGTTVPAPPPHSRRDAPPSPEAQRPKPPTDLHPSASHASPQPSTPPPPQRSSCFEEGLSVETSSQSQSEGALPMTAPPADQEGQTAALDEGTGPSLQDISRLAEENDATRQRQTRSRGLWSDLLGG
ncbi:hypothetical protein C1H76_2702 [Elsinoe australis]|uniref:Uncharacterized protein n=1 Tax=Elsinoe australis TaxID=40998 RepID=A0A4U7B8B4_9PEZI|nr:hypothetical protein C1H76_2702 [Elsinoe australis]